MDRLKTLGQRADWVLAALLAVLADQLFHDGAMGSTAGGFAVALVAAVLIAQPAVREDRRSRWALALTVGFAFLQFDRPSLLGWLLFASSVSVAVLSPHFAAGVDALGWLNRGAWQFWAGLIAPVRDGAKAISKADPGRLGGLTFLTMAAWPLIGLVVFGALFRAVAQGEHFFFRCAGNDSRDIRISALVVTCIHPGASAHRAPLQQ